VLLEEYRRIRNGAVGISRGESYDILQQALRNYAMWVASAEGLEAWLPKERLGNVC
jgi:hypothetical protein